jgi:hypothetical protein
LVQNARDLQRPLGQQQQKRFTPNRQTPPRATVTPKPPPISADPLRSTDLAILNATRTKLPFAPAVPYLGVLIDGGRHYFPMEWLKKVVDRLSDMNYNLIHLRLTDDQSFNVLLDSHPELAWPTSVNNADLKVYTVAELRDLTQYAKQRGIRIMPEVNVPGHAGSWAGVPGLIVHCPEFICEKGYGIPINVTHPALRPLLTSVLKELVDVFDDPPFFHLGGDEVNMAGPCFDEVGAKVFDYPAFERVLKLIIADVGYPEERIVRWEMTGQANLDRAGKIEQFWESHPGDRHEAAGPFFVSTWMYFDTNGDENSHTVYTKSQKSFHLKSGRLPTAIIAGCFELSPQFWFERNILGRLLSVAMGASNLTFDGDKTAVASNVIGKHKEYCLGLGFGKTVCDKEGAPMIPTRVYHLNWKQDWVVWKADICNRLTNTIPHRTFRSFRNAYTASTLQASVFYWNNFPLPHVTKGATRKFPVPAAGTALLMKHVIPHTGVILDTVNSMVLPERLTNIIEEDVAALGFNLVQLRLVTNDGFSVQLEEENKLGFSFTSGASTKVYDLFKDLAPIVQNAAKLGVEIMPEIGVSTDGGGWFNTGFMLPCGMHFCHSKHTPNNVNDPLLLPVIFQAIVSLYAVFSSKFIHLGSDERESTEPCFHELGTKANFDGFETKLAHLLKSNGIPTENILRYGNKENKIYKGRTGGITQYHAGNYKAKYDEKFFATVDVLEGSAWEVYQRTKSVVEDKPFGVMAELRALLKGLWGQVQLEKRLLAFAMGVSELPAFNDEEAFGESFRKICHALKWDSDCTPPSALPNAESVLDQVESSQFREQVCNARTMVSTKHVAKDVTPHFEDAVAAKVKG